MGERVADICMAFRDDSSFVTSSGCQSKSMRRRCGDDFADFEFGVTDRVLMQPELPAAADGVGKRTCSVMPNWEEKDARAKNVTDRRLMRANCY